jgi:hypothetical protein
MDSLSSGVQYDSGGKGNKRVPEMYNVGREITWKRSLGRPWRRCDDNLDFVLMVKIKVKISLFQAVEAPRVARCRGSHIT